MVLDCRAFSFSCEMQTIKSVQRNASDLDELVMGAI